MTTTPSAHYKMLEQAKTGPAPKDRSRMYLPTLAELIDRLAIVQIKEIFIPEYRSEFRCERMMIEHDIDLIMEDKMAAGWIPTARFLHACQAVMLTNRYIWENESRARLGGAEQDKLLKLTHSINGVRNTSKNVISHDVKDRLDYKVDCFAESLVEEFGNWNIFT